MTLRELFIDWLTSSRYIKSLESARIEQRQLYESLLADKSEQIKSLRIQVAGLDAECRQLRGELNPKLRQYVGRQEQKPQVKPEFAAPVDWQAEVQRIAKEQQDGTHELGRKEVHQQASNDGAPAQFGPAEFTRRWNAELDAANRSAGTTR